MGGWAGVCLMETAASSAPRTRGTRGSDLRNNRTWVVVSGTQTSRLSQRSTEPGQPVSRKMPTVIDRAWEIGRAAIFKIIKSTILLGGLSCPHEMNRHARSHGYNWKRLFPTMRTCLICKSKSKTLFVKQSVVIRQNLMSCYRQWEIRSRVTTFDAPS